MAFAPLSVFSPANRHRSKSALTGALLSVAAAFSSAAMAGPPAVSIDGASQNNAPVYVSNPVRLSGRAADPDGIKKVRGWINVKGKKIYVSSASRLTRDRKVITFGFRKTSQGVAWATQDFKLNAGTYTLNVLANDRRGNQSQVRTLDFIVGKKPANDVNIASNSQAAPAKPATSAATAKPLVAIRAPQNGATLTGVAAFSGLARHATGIRAVNGTVQNRANGLFLGNDGKFHRRAQLKMKVGKGAKPKWVAPRMQLPAGNYIFAVQSIANDGTQSKWSQSAFTVAAAVTNNQTINATQQPAAQPATQPAAQAATGNQLASNGMAYCRGANSDPDGDGFGWQNNQSCVVKGSRADTHPNCASAASDPDGDGYGWENERSCIVVTHCASSASDPDGDGFGWENNRSCIVLKQAQGRYPACASNASDPDGDGYGWENNKTCLVK